MKSKSLSEWLKSHDLEQFVEIFDENEVDLATLRILTESDLKELGLPFGPRKRILNILREEKVLEKSAAPQADISTSERRQLAVLFCDMVGFTKLSYKLDPEAMQSVLRAYERTCETCVNRYDGYVFRILGDGIVAFFGFPLAHESGAERAVRAGLDIISAIAGLNLQSVGRLQVRIGIPSGMVVIASGERNAVGETINLAARLQTIAKPGSVVVSESVRRMAGGEFEYEDLGEKELKGVSGLTKIYRVLDVSRAESRFEAATQHQLTPIVGRNTEISALVDSWLQVSEKQTGRAVLLRGERGIVIDPRPEARRLEFCFPETCQRRDDARPHRMRAGRGTRGINFAVIRGRTLGRPVDARPARTFRGTASGHSSAIGHHRSARVQLAIDESPCRRRDRSDKIHLGAERFAGRERCRREGVAARPRRSDHCSYRRRSFIRRRADQIHPGVG